MFTIPEATLAFWARLDLSPATDAQITEIERLAPGPLPGDYVAFLKKYGFVRWMLTVPDRFRYSSAMGSQEVVKVAAVAHLETPESIARAMGNAWSDQPELGLPCWPQGVMPLAGNAGPGQVLLDFATDVPSVRYWEPAEDPWGRGDNTKLWEIAPDFTRFVNGLRTRDEV